MSFDMLCSAILVGELIAFYFFYQSKHGSTAVYHSWYAWIIDVLGVVSGIVIMTLAVVSYHHPAYFTLSIPSWLLVLIFIQGSWQTAIHAIKALVKIRHIAQQK